MLFIHSLFIVRAIYQKKQASQSTLDLTAIYGEDYIILDDNAEKTGDGVSILERYATAEADTDETSDNISEENTDIENYSEFDSEMAQQFADEVVPDAMAEIEYSSSTTVTFAPGENEKTVKFKILDDKKKRRHRRFFFTFGKSR